MEYFLKYILSSKALDYPHTSTLELELATVFCNSAVRPQI